MLQVYDVLTIINSIYIYIWLPFVLCKWEPTYLPCIDRCHMHDKIEALQRMLANILSTLYAACRMNRAILQLLETPPDKGWANRGYTQKSSVVINRMCSQPVTIFAMKKNSAFWSKHWQGFQPISSWYRRTLYNSQLRSPISLYML